MAKLVKFVKGANTYYYLEETFREGKSVRKKRKYIGKEVPKDIDKIRRKFTGQVIAERWHPIFSSILKGYRNELKRMPALAKEKLIESFMVSFTYDTQRIEGSTLSFKDTAQVLLEHTTPKGAQVRDVREAEMHRKVFYQMLSYSEDISLRVILQWHSELFSETQRGEAGKIRDFNVKITNSKFVPPDYVYIESMLGNFMAWYHSNRALLHPIELAALAHLKFVTIHPFGDGNGRISRLLMNFILNRSGYPMLDIKYANRRSYYNALERSQTSEEESIFLLWFFRRYLKENRGYSSK